MAPYFRLLQQSDIPSVIDCWYAAFDAPSVTALVPNNESTRAWWTKSYEMFLPSDSSPATDPKKQESFVLVMISEDGKDGEEKQEKVVAFARYWLFGEEWTEDWTTRYSMELGGEMTAEKIGDNFLMPMARQHRIAMGNRKHIFLDTLATHPQYQKLGLGGQLVEWGNKKADEEGIECYLDASSKGKGLYEKFGYVEEPVKDPATKSVPMRRPVKVQN